MNGRHYFPYIRFTSPKTFSRLSRCSCCWLRRRRRLRGHQSEKASGQGPERAKRLRLLSDPQSRHSFQRGLHSLLAPPRIAPGCWERRALLELGMALARQHAGPSIRQTPSGIRCVRRVLAPLRQRRLKVGGMRQLLASFFIAHCIQFDSTGLRSGVIASPASKDTPTDCRLFAGDTDPL